MQRSSASLQFILAILLAVLTHAAPSRGTSLTHLGTSSVFYPLATGDYWEYFDYADFNGGIVDTVSRLVAVDTSINSLTFKAVHWRSFRYHVQWESFERFDSAGNLFTYSNGNESLTYRFSDTSRTPWTIGSTLRRWEQNFVDTLFGMPRHVLLALTYQPWDTLGLFGLGNYLTEGLGMTASPTPEGGGYRLRGAKIAGIIYGTITSVEENRRNVPDQYSLLQNYPNPFNPSTTIEYSLPHRSFVTLKVYNILGQEVVTLVEGEIDPGRHSITWNVEGKPSGVYFCRLSSMNKTMTIRLLMLK